MPSLDTLSEEDSDSSDYPIFPTPQHYSPPPHINSTLPYINPVLNICDIPGSDSDGGRAYSTFPPLHTGHYPSSPHTNSTLPSTNPVYLYTCDIHSSGFDGNDGNPASIDTNCWVCLFTAHSSHNHNIIPTIAHLSYSSKPITFQQLHEKLGHLNEEHLKSLLKSDSLKTIKVKGPMF